VELVQFVRAFLPSRRRGGAEADAALRPTAILAKRVRARAGLPMIGKLLGQTQVQTTARHAHLAADPVKSTADQVSARVAAALNAGVIKLFNAGGEQS
jgi:hypothetical protein